MLDYFANLLLKAVMLSRGCHYIGGYYIITQVELLQDYCYIIVFNQSLSDIIKNQ